MTAMLNFTSNHPHDAGRSLVDRGALLLDVRTPEEYGAGHVSGALNIPLQVLPQRIANIGSKERPVVVYCRSGARSATATRILRAAGYDVTDIGPMPRW